MTTKTDTRATLTVAETARVLGLSERTTRAAIRRGEIPALRIGGRILVPRGALERLFDREAEVVR